MRPPAASLANVSYSVLSAVPWAGTSRLVSIMDQVARRGPNDRKTWSTLLRRAEIILDSFSAANLARMAVLLGKSAAPNRAFLEKLKLKALAKAEEADLLACCGLLFGFRRLGVADPELVSRFRGRVTAQLASATGPYPLVLVLCANAQLLNVYANAKDRAMAVTLLEALARHTDSLTPQAFAMVLGDALSNFGDPELHALLGPFVVNSLSCVERMDFRSLVQLYACFARASHPLRSEYLQTLAGCLARRVQQASLHQLSVILRAYAKCQVDPALLRGVVGCLRAKYEAGELQELLFVLSHLLKLNLGDLGVARELLGHILRFRNISAVQFSNLVYLAGKFGLELPGGYVADHFGALRDAFSLRDLALFSYGLDRLGRRELWGELAAMAERMLGRPELYDTVSHLMLRRTFSQLA